MSRESSRYDHQDRLDGRKALAQPSDDRTDYRFPPAVYEATETNDADM